MLYKLKGEGPSTVFVPLKPTSIAAQGLAEKAMEHWLAANPEAVVPSEERMLVIGQEKAFENLTDILAVDAEGNAVVIEIKRGQTPRDVIAQALEYVSDVEGWDYAQLNQRALPYFSSRNIEYESLLSAFQKTFAIAAGDFDESQFNRRQRIFIVGETIEPKIERTARWLLRRGVEIACLSYLCYRSDEGELFLNFEEVVRPDGPVSKAALHPIPDETQFIQKMSELVRELYRELKRRAQGFGPDVQVGTTGSYIKFMAANNFAEVQPRKDRLVVYVRPEGFTIPEDSSATVHGVTVTRVPDRRMWTLNHWFVVTGEADMLGAEQLLRHSYDAVRKGA